MPSEAYLRLANLMVKLNTKKILLSPGGDSKAAAGYVYLEFQ